MVEKNSGEIIESLTLGELCKSCDVDAAWIFELVDEGVLEPIGRDQATWRFRGTCIATTTKAKRLKTDLGINTPGIALVLVLLEEKMRLEVRLNQLDSDPDVVTIDV